MNFPDIDECNISATESAES
eukprot:UN10979